MAFAKHKARQEPETPDAAAPNAPAEVEPMPGFDPEVAERQSPGGRNWGSDHPVNLRVSIPLPFRRVYLTIVGGQERRSPQRRRAERKRHPLATWGNLAFLVAVGVVVGLAGVAALQMFVAFVFQEIGFVS